MADPRPAARPVLRVSAAALLAAGSQPWCQRQEARGRSAARPQANIAEVSIDQSNLPAVKGMYQEVASGGPGLALPGTETEHHLADVQLEETRLISMILQVAKQFQDRNLKAQAQLQKHYKDLEQDCEIAWRFRRTWIFIYS